ncbi:MAG: iron ABC transporter permease [Nocardioides sp.]
MSSLRRPSGMTVMVTAAIAALGLLIVLPLTIQVITAFRGPFLPFGVPTATWGGTNFQTLWSLRADFGATLWTTTLFVGGATVLAVGIAGGLAWLVARTDLPGRNLVAVLVVVPYIIPPIVKAQAFYLMLSPKTGIANQLLRALPFVDGSTGPIDPFSFPVLVVIQALSNVTFPFLLLMPVLQYMDGSLEEAARVSGASWRRTVTKVTLPVLAPAIAGVVVLSAILNLGSLEVPLLFGQQAGRDIFALKLWNLISSNVGELPQYGLAAAYGMVFLVFTSVLFWTYRRATRHADNRASVTGKGFRPQRLPLGGLRTPMLAVVWVFLLITALLPLLSLLWAACTPFPLAMTADNLRSRTDFSAFGDVLADPEFWAALGRTLIIASASATIAVVVATVLAYAVARGRPGWRMTVLDTVASSSLAIPATIAGFSFFVLFLVTNRYVALNGTLLALVVAYSYRVSVAYRTSYSATLQIKKELEEAAAVSGAPPSVTFRRIVLPLLLPAMFAVWIQMFILSANEFTLSAFLATPESRPLSTYLYSMISPRQATLYAPDRGAAMALIFTLFVVVIGYGLQ